MKTNKLLVFGGLLILSSSVFSDGATIFYRDASGGITKESRQHASAMHKIADKQGYVTLWLLFDLPFNEAMHTMTEDELAEHKIFVANYADDVLGTLVDTNQVWHPKAGPLVAGLGCNVRATPQGLSNLLKEKRIIQIVSVDNQ